MCCAVQTLAARNGWSPIWCHRSPISNVPMCYSTVWSSEPKTSVFQLTRQHFYDLVPSPTQRCSFFLLNHVINCLSSRPLGDQIWSTVSSGIQRLLAARRRTCFYDTTWPNNRKQTIQHILYIAIWRVQCAVWHTTWLNFMNFVFRKLAQLSKVR